MDEETKALTSTLNSFWDYSKTTQFNLVKVRRKRLDRLKQQFKDHQNFVKNNRKIHNYYEYARKSIEPQLTVIEDGIQNNKFFLESVAEVAAMTFGAPEDQSSWEDTTINEISKVISLLSQVTREWSLEGLEERDQSMGKVIREIENLFPELDSSAKDQLETQLNNLQLQPESLEGQADSKTPEGVLPKESIIKQFTRDRNNVKIVIPGCGLGRLALELAARGFQAQGNEVSFAMLFTSNFMLNYLNSVNQFRINPWIHSFSHVRSHEFQTRPVLVPDVLPSEFLTRRERAFGKPAGELTMVAGSFDEVYPVKKGERRSIDVSVAAVESSKLHQDQKLEDHNGDKNADNTASHVVNDHKDEQKNEDDDTTLVDVVATVFFIDTSPNIFKTLDTISRMLVKGGYWINFGPLLWHYEHSFPMSISRRSSSESHDTQIHTHSHNNLLDSPQINVSLANETINEFKNTTSLESSTNQNKKTNTNKNDLDQDNFNEIQGQNNNNNSNGTTEFENTNKENRTTTNCKKGVNKSEDEDNNISPVLKKAISNSTDGEESMLGSTEDDYDHTAGLELSLNAILSLLPEYGLKVIKHESNIYTTYAIDKMSMNGNGYKCDYWVAIKE